MYDIYYNLLIDNNFLGGAIQYQSIEVLCRYLAVAMSIGTFVLVVLCIFACFKKVCKWFI